MRIDDENKVVWCSGELFDWYNSFKGSYLRKKMMIYYISRIGWGYALTDYENKKIDAEFYENIDKLLSIKAIIDDYEFKLEQPKKYYWRKKKEHLAWFEDEHQCYLNKYIIPKEGLKESVLCLGNFYKKGEHYREYTLRLSEQEARVVLNNGLDMFERVEV